MKRGLALVGMFVAGVVVGLALAFGPHRIHSTPPILVASAEVVVPPPLLVNMSAVIDGSDQVSFSRDAVKWQHHQWSRPRNVMFNGEPWPDLNDAPPNWPELAKNLDLTKAVITLREGRDLIILETTIDGFDLFFADTQMGSGPYRVTFPYPAD